MKDMDAEKGPQNENLNPETSYLYEKMSEAFDTMTERIVDQFTYSKFVEYNGAALTDFYDRNVVENLVHLIRNTIRQDFKAAFLNASVMYNLKENLRTVTIEIEKAKLLKEFEEISGNLFSQGPEYYFEFLAGVIKRLKDTNEEVGIANHTARSREHGQS